MKLKQLFKRGTAILLSIAMVYPLLLPGSTAQAETTSELAFYEDFEDTEYSTSVQRNDGYREPNKAGEDPFWVINDGGYVSGGTQLSTNEHSFEFFMSAVRGAKLSMQMGENSELDLNFTSVPVSGQWQVSLSFNDEVLLENVAAVVTWYTVKLLRLGDSLAVKVWKSSEEEPADYTYTVTDPSFADTYGLKVASSGATTRFDNFSGSFQAEPVPSFDEDFEDTDYSTAVQRSNGYQATITDKNLWIINDGGYVSGGTELQTNEHSFEFLMYGTKDYTLSMQMGGNSNLNLYFKAINTAKGSLYFNDRILGESILDLGCWYTAKLLRSGNFLGIKFWKTGETEPTDYTYIVTDPLFADTYGLKVAPAGGAGARFDNFSGKQSTETLEPSFKEDFEDTIYSTAVQRNDGYRTTVSDKNVWIINDGGYVSGGTELSTNEHSFEFFVADLNEAKISMQMGGKSELDLNFTVNLVRPNYYVSLSFNDEVLAENTFNILTWYKVKLLRFGDNLAIKVWESSAEEPADYTYTVTDPLFADTYGLKVTWSSGATAGKTVRFDEFSGKVTEVEEKGFFVDGDINPYTGVLQSTDTSQEYTLDANYNSVGYDLKTKRQVNQVVLTDNDGVHRLHHIDLSLYVSDDNVTYTKVPYFDMARSGNQIYLYNFAEVARYVKVHCHYDTYAYDTDKNINGFTNMLGSMITAGYETIPGSGGGNFTQLGGTMTLTASSNGEDVFGYIPYSKLVSLEQCNEDKSDLRFVYDGKMLPYMLDKEGAYVRVSSVTEDDIVEIDVYGGNASAVSLSDSEIFEVTYGNKTISELRTSLEHSSEIGVVCAPNGDLLTLAGSYPTGNITLKRSTDGGRTWGNVETIYTWDQAEIDAIKTAGGTPYIGMGDQFLVDDGKIWAPVHYGDDFGKMEIFMLYSEDNGENWSTIELNTGKYRPLTYSQPVRVKSHDGAGDAIDYVFPYQFRTEELEFMLSALISRDQGATWETIDAIIKWPTSEQGHEMGLSESTTMVLSDGTLKILMRNQYEGTTYFAEATSTDNGLTWSKPKYSNVVSTNTMPASMTRTYNDKTEQYLLWAGNNSMGGTSYQRYPFTLAYSDDDTATWKQKLDLFSGTTRAKFTYNGSVTAFDSSDTGGSGGVTQPSMALGNYKGDGEDLMVTWTHTWGRPVGMLIEDFDNFIHKTKGASDDFEGSTAKYESWHNATTLYKGEGTNIARMEGTIQGSVELSSEKSNGGTQSLKLQDVTKAEYDAAGKAAILRATRSIPGMTSGEVSFDVNLEKNNAAFIFELKSAFNKTHNDYSLLLVRIENDGSVYSVNPQDGTKSDVLCNITLTEWNHFTVKFDVDTHTAQLYVNDQFVGDILVNDTINEPVCYAQFSKNTGWYDQLICYIDNFRAYEGLTLHADYASTVVAPEITDSIAMNYTTTIEAGLPKAILADGEIPYMTFAMEGKTTVKVEGKLTEGVYTFTYPDIKAQNMAKTITATLVVGNYTKEYEYSVWDYCKAVLDETDYTKLDGLKSADDLEKVKHLVVDLVQYGAALQTYRKDAFSDAFLLSNKLTETHKDYDKDSATESLDSIIQSDRKVEDQAGRDYKWTSATLVLKNKINLRFRFTIPEGSSTENLVVKATIGNVPYELDIQKDSKGYYVDFDNIMAYEYGEKVNVTIYTAGDAKASAKITYSVNSYLYDMKSNTNTDLTALLLAIHSFGTAAQQYQGR